MNKKVLIWGAMPNENDGGAIVNYYQLQAMNQIDPEWIVHVAPKVWEQASPDLMPYLKWHQIRTRYFGQIPTEIPKIMKKYGIPYLVLWHIPWEYFPIIDKVHKIGAKVINWQTIHWSNDVLFLSDKLQDFDWWISPTNYALETLVKEGNLDRNKMTEIPHGVNLECFYPHDARKLRGDLGIRENQKMILFVGRCQLTKGIVPMMLTARKLCNNFNCHIVFKAGVHEGVTKAKEIAHLLHKMTNWDSRIHFLSQWTTPSFMEELTAACDILVCPSGHEGFCVLPQTPIITEDGIILIQNAFKGKKVIIGNGMLNPIGGVMMRDYKGSIYTIKTSSYTTPITFTPEHPILIYRRKSKRYRKCKLEWEEPQWIEAKNVKVGDCVAFPIPNDIYDDVIFDLANYDDNLLKDDNNVWYKMGFSPKRKLSYSQVSKELNVGKMVVEATIRWMRKDKPFQSDAQRKVARYLIDNNFQFSSPIKFKRFIKLDEKLASLLGYYVAEGFTWKNGLNFIGFAFHRKEKEYHGEVIRLIKEIFGQESFIIEEKNKPNSTSIIASGKILARFFSSLCGLGALNKRIPKEILFNKNKQILEACLRTMMNGDGHYEKNREYYQYNTSSITLANQCWILLLRLGYKPALTKRTKSRFSINPNYKINYSPKKNIRNNGTRSWIINDRFLMLIRKIEIKEYDGKVMDLHIDNEEHSFVASHFIIHNSLPPLEAMACQRPVCVTDIPVHRELLGGKNGVCGLLMPPMMRTEYVNDVQMVTVPTSDMIYGSVKYLLENPDEAKAMGEKGLVRVKEYYDLKDICNKWFKLLEKLI